MKGGIDYNGYIATGRNNRKPSEVSKLTRKEAAVKLDMKEERLQDLETGRKGLTLGEAIKYADTYNVSLDYIVGRKKVEY